MRRISKYSDFLSKMNEDQDPMITPESSEINSQEGFESTEDAEDNDVSNIIDSEEDVSPEKYKDNDEEEEEYNKSEEEESGEYKGTTLMKELARKLGTEIKNNEILYDGNKINFYSEDEKFHIGRNKFNKVDEVVNFLKGGSKFNELTESKRFNRKLR